MAETTSARFQSRRAMLDKEHALNTARNPGDSKYGNALYRNNTHEGRVYSAELTKIDKQLKITSMHIDQEKKQFMAKYTRKEPMLIVVRPPSPKSIRKHEWTQYNLENNYAYGHPKYRGGPRYMDPLKSRVRTPNYRPTIDAFCVQTKKKVNVWEKELLEKEPPKFRSTVMPSYPLSTSEVRDLIKALEFHRQAMEEARKRPKTKKKQKADGSPSTRTTDSVGTPWQFVTDVTTNGPVGDSTPGINGRQVDGKQSGARLSGRSGQMDEPAVTFNPERESFPKKKLRHDDDGNAKRPSGRSSTSTLRKRDQSNSNRSTPRKPKAYSNSRPNNAFKKLSTNATCLVRRDPNPAPPGPPVDNANAVSNREVGEHSAVLSHRPKSVLRDSRSGKEQRDFASIEDPDVKKKSGMALILEAAMDGMTSPSSHGAVT